jgi:hypothetical protein
VTRLSRKVLAGLGLVAGLGIGGALIHALQTRKSGPDGEELFSTANRRVADGLAGLPRDYAGPLLGPPLPGDLGCPTLDAQNRGQPVPVPAPIAPAIDPAEQRRRAEDEATPASPSVSSSPATSSSNPIEGENGPGRTEGDRDGAEHDLVRAEQNHARQPAPASPDHAENAKMPKLKLGPIADDKPVKVTLDLPAALHRDPIAYAEILASETGQKPADPARLIVPMLERSSPPIAD